MTHMIELRISILCWPGMLLNTPQCPGWPHREQSDLVISRAAAEEIQACKVRVPRSGGLEPNVCGGEAGKSAAEAVAPLSMGFSRPEYWSWVPLPSPEDLPNPGIELRSPAL